MDSVYFSTLDLAGGYWQVPLNRDAQEKEASVTEEVTGSGKCCFLGSSKPITFERPMEQILKK